ncbi:PilZ domain-containing protein [Burkholderia ubonensis]|uniref:PilZ domain-containing protein n=2 Tax=Burkholderia ubonensis TaxID=101571 RepID=UPI0007588468|nr:PilZ domain-containing protein [Burkholderia ubonensis]KVP45219.1 pilus assembly protein PilZ [Burkholderia ubonensis]KVR53990.1 pilus assembly protein PilZ [Burkholderia ubonensis]KWB45937.1 pilus assembly protein PilZ [Burkholderia ubonensis]KWD45189.1 pilus assembly protein PilZ [Burkholderia ubonensis]KWI04680.1 pilus assembly protein PilZ [Burkholderia ubonensis]
MRTSYNFVALEHDDFLAGAPLGFDVYDLGGAALLPAGTTLHDPAQPAFLFDHFQPARRGAAGLGVAGLGPAAGPAEPQKDGVPSVAHMGLWMGAPIGLRRRVGATRTMLRCRLIGQRASQSLLVEPQHATALEFRPGDGVEAIAIGRAAAYRFAATVDMVQPGPAPFMALSPPGFIECLRVRAEPRVPARLAARCCSVQDGVGSFGIVRDISLSGLSVAASQTIAAAGEPLRIRLPYEVGGNVALLTLDGTVRHTHADPAAPQLVLHHVAYGDDIEPADVVRLKALLFDRLMASAEWGGVN